MRFHVEHSAAAERLIDDVAQPRVVWLIHRQHIIGDRSDRLRHPPGQAHERPALLTQREQRAFLQHPRRRFIGRGHPDAAYDREFRRDGRTDRPQLRDAGLRITKKRLAGEIEIHTLCHRAVPHCPLRHPTKMVRDSEAARLTLLVDPCRILNAIDDPGGALTPAACRAYGTTRSSSAPTPGPSCALPRSR